MGLAVSAEGSPEAVARALAEQHGLDYVALMRHVGPGGYGGLIYERVLRALQAVHERAAAQEREACARDVESWQEALRDTGAALVAEENIALAPVITKGMAKIVVMMAESIRARGQ